MSEIEILENLKKYLQFLLDSGTHKIFYNDLFWSEKTIDCINAINNLQEENKQLKEKINDAIDYINKNKQIESTYKCSVDGTVREFNTYKLYCEPSELLAILGDKE